MIQAVIFDLNGTILSDEDEYGLAYGKVLESLGVQQDDKYPHISGIGVEENWPYLIEKYKVDTKKTKEELSKETQIEYLKLLDSVKLKKGFKRFVNELMDNNIRIALATSNNWSMVENILKKFDIESYFEVVTTREEVQLTKPNPAIFLRTADKMYVAPPECAVFEDSEAGLQAAKTAGMKSVGVARSVDYEIKLGKADVVIQDYDNIKVSDIIHL
jgi:HAD superfamily hydrolase (TIGR01509 family)